MSTGVQLVPLLLPGSCQLRAADLIPGGAAIGRAPEEAGVASVVTGEPNLVAGGRVDFDGVEAAIELTRAGDAAEDEVPIGVTVDRFVNVLLVAKTTVLGSAERPTMKLSLIVKLLSR